MNYFTHLSQGNTLELTNWRWFSWCHSLTPAAGEKNGPWTVAWSLSVGLNCTIHITHWWFHVKSLRKKQGWLQIVMSKSKNTYKSKIKQPVLGQFFQFFLVYIHLIFYRKNAFFWSCLKCPFAENSFACSNPHFALPLLLSQWHNLKMGRNTLSMLYILTLASLVVELFQRFWQAVKT